MTEFNAAPYDPVSPERWSYLKQLKVGPGTMIHTSCEAYMIENPFSKHLPLVPFVSKLGVTYKNNNNILKRENRRASIEERKWLRWSEAK